MNKLNFKLEASDSDTNEIIYIREFSTQEIMEEYLREMARQVEIYLDNKNSGDLVI